MQRLIGIVALNTRDGSRHMTWTEAFRFVSIMVDTIKG